MLIYEKYLIKQIYLAFLFILIALSGLFSFFDFVNEFGKIGDGQYNLLYATLNVILLIPSHTYEVLPIAILVGSIYVFAKAASSSEWTILRLAGLSPQKALVLILKLSIPLIITSVFIGEILVPYADLTATYYKIKAFGPKNLASSNAGAWLRNQNKNQTDSIQFININALNARDEIEQIKIYNFNEQLDLKSIQFAVIGVFSRPNTWLLKNVTEIKLPEKSGHIEKNKLENLQKISSRHYDEFELALNINPKILAGLLAPLDRMSGYSLYAFINHLIENKQNAKQYEVVFWQKVFYPIAILVMLTIALPFAYLHARSKSISIKIFGGIVLGVLFQILNSLFSHIGLMISWPALISAAMPGLIFVTFAIACLAWVNRH